MTVKTIFRTLIGTILVMVVGSLLIEIFNISVISLQITQLSKEAAKQACELFSQESYRQLSDEDEKNVYGGMYSMEDIKAEDGHTYISGKFYGTLTNDADKDAKAIWAKIYKNKDFDNFCRGTLSTNSRGTKFKIDSGIQALTNLQLLDRGLFGDTAQSTVVDEGWGHDDYSDEVQVASDKVKAKQYADEMYTAVNLGVPYMDDEILNKMYQWNLAQLLSNCNPANIHKSDETTDPSSYYVEFKGFKVFCDKARITEYRYNVFSILPNTPSELTNAFNIGDSLGLYNLTHIQYNPSSGQLGNTNLKEQLEKNGDSLIQESAPSSFIGSAGKLSNRYDNALVTTVSLDYNAPITYAGITPIKRIFNWVNSRSVSGVDNASNSHSNAKWNTKVAYFDSDKAASDGYSSTGEYVFTLIK